MRPSSPGSPRPSRWWCAWSAGGSYIEAANGARGVRPGGALPAARLHPLRPPLPAPDRLLVGDPPRPPAAPPGAEPAPPPSPAGAAAPPVCPTLPRTCAVRGSGPCAAPCSHCCWWWPSAPPSSGSGRTGSADPRGAPASTAWPAACSEPAGWPARRGGSGCSGCWGWPCCSTPGRSLSRLSAPAWPAECRIAPAWAGTGCRGSSPGWCCWPSPPCSSCSWGGRGPPRAAGGAWPAACRVPPVWAGPRGGCPGCSPCWSPSPWSPSWSRCSRPGSRAPRRTARRWYARSSSRPVRAPRRVARPLPCGVRRAPRAPRARRGPGGARGARAGEDLPCACGTS